MTLRPTSFNYHHAGELGHHGFPLRYIVLECIQMAQKSRLVVQNRGYGIKMSSLNHRNHGVDLAKRLRDIREDLYGEHGSQFMADALGVPLQPG